MADPTDPQAAEREIERLRRELAARERQIAALQHGRAIPVTPEWGAVRQPSAGTNLQSTTHRPSPSDIPLAQPLLPSTGSTESVGAVAFPPVRPLSRGSRSSRASEPNSATAGSVRPSTGSSAGSPPYPLAIPVALAVAPGSLPHTASGSAKFAHATAMMTDEQLARHLQQQEELDAARARHSESYRSYGATASYAPPTSLTPGIGSLSDAQLAAAIQQEEMMMAAHAQQMVAQRARDEPPVLEDPMWGELVGRPGKPFRPHELLCFSMCPCCTPPMCSGSRAQGWRRLVRMSAFWFSVVQIVLCCVSLYWRGLAPTAINPMIGPWPDILDLVSTARSERSKRRRIRTPVAALCGRLHVLLLPALLEASR